MNRRGFISSAGALTALGAVSTLPQPVVADQEKGKRRPNLVYVFPDQMRRHAMGFMKQDPVQTPNLDAFAKRSVVLSNACSTYPVCSPHRASLLTGQYPQTTGFYTNCRGDRPDLYLKPESRCLTDVLHDSGYHVGYIGKWHLERGAPGMGYASPWVSKGRRHSIDFWHSWCDMHRNEAGERIPWETSHFHFGYWTNEAGPEDRLFPGPIWSPIYETNVAIDYINNRNGERDPSKPFALFVSWNPPHNPYDSVPKNYVDKYDGATIEELLNRPNVRFEGAGADSLKYAKSYFASVTGVDDQFGRILKAIEKAGIEEETVIVFTSDHGEMMGSHGEMGKPYFWEEAYGVPFMISWKGQLQPREEKLLLGTPDIMPTLLGLLGLGGAIPDSVEGSNYVDALFDRPQAARPEFAWYYNAWNARGVRTDTECCYFYRGQGRGNQDLFFDLKNDPFQLENLSAKNLNRMRELGRETKAWLAGLDDRFVDRKTGLSYFDSIPG
ncbi:sulfatase [Pelagicoccus sp. SDUM812005]|uniref:sulfatase family protein n=1 Tax=Pelagicoccus sp. SDUM812005 TaxID=3041257 RepID=UPI00280CEBF5|nr:sulfatase [Pelagicoccus sp. SDUM812005]MDQ8180327.1 sulfatase [Pelagicoccus sp. SDUM812005]